MNLPVRTCWLVAIVMGAVSVTGAQEDKASASKSGLSEDGGARTFATTCASCHGLDGRGGERGPDIVSSREAQKLSSAMLFRIVRDGVPGTGMPSFRAFGPKKIQAVAQYVRHLQGQSRAVSLSGQPAAGKALFFGKAKCADCHMVSGIGGFIGSDLSGYGRTQSATQIRRALTDSNGGVHERAKSVAVTLADGKSFNGIVRNEDNFSVQLQTFDGTFVLLDKSAIRGMERRPEPLANSAARLSPQELDDIASYLISLGRTPAPGANTRNAGQPNRYSKNSFPQSAPIPRKRSKTASY